eukprot:ctg_4988.g659
MERHSPLVRRSTDGRAAATASTARNICVARLFHPVRSGVGSGGTRAAKLPLSAVAGRGGHGGGGSARSLCRSQAAGDAFLAEHRRAHRAGARSAGGGASVGRLRRHGVHSRAQVRWRIRGQVRAAVGQVSRDELSLRGRCVAASVARAGRRALAHHGGVVAALQARAVRLLRPR